MFDKIFQFMKKNVFPSFISLLIILLSIFYSYYNLIPHKISGKETSEDKFSTVRALEHIKVISKEYHFVGTPYHKEIRNYLINKLNKLGLKTEVQSQFSVNEKWGGATINHNIIATLKGTGTGKALMILSHYDSAPFASKGASDDAVGVAAILEGIRAFIKSGTPHENDIIIMFSDGEEIGLNGAKAFMEHHPLAKNVGLVINFEARGSGGPSFTLMETNGGNAQMVKAFASAENDVPVANSFLYSVYKMLPNDTDLTMFREIGDIEGFNFAFIDDFYNYHCSTDSYENVDINTVEHQGIYLMSLLQTFKNYDLNDIKSKNDLIYFNFPIIGMIYYPFEWATAIFIIFVILTLVLLIFGLLKHKLKFKKLLFAFIPLFIVLISGIVLSIFGWKLIMNIHPWFNDILHGFPYSGHIYVAAFCFFLVGLFLWIYRIFHKKLNITELAFPIIILWIIVTGFLTFGLTGASFFIIPSYLLLIILYLENFSKLDERLEPAIYSLVLVPSLLIISPFIDMFPVGLKMKALPVSIFLLILMLGTILPLILKWKFNKSLAYLSFIVSIILFSVAEFKSGYNISRPKQNSLNYVYYADENRAYWETFNESLDPWLTKIFGKNPQKGCKADVLLNSKYNSRVNYNTPAPKISIKLPEINVLKDSIAGEYRTLEFEFISQRNINYFELLTTKPIEFHDFSINDHKFNDKFLSFKKGKNSLISYYITEKGEKPRIKFTLEKEIKPQFVIYESSYDLLQNQELKVPPRTSEYIPMPFVLNDQIIVIKKIEF